MCVCKFLMHEKLRIIIGSMNILRILFIPPNVSVVIRVICHLFVFLLFRVLCKCKLKILNLITWCKKATRIWFTLMSGPRGNAFYYACMPIGFQNSHSFLSYSSPTENVSWRRHITYTHGRMVRQSAS